MKKEAVTKTKAVKTAKKPTKKAVKKEVTPVQASEPVIQAAVVSTSSMSLSTKVIIGIAAAVCVGLGFLYVKYWNIAIVNGNPISRISYYKSMESQIGKQTLSNMVTETLIEDAGEKGNVVVDAKTVSDKVAEIETKIKAQGQTLDEALVAEGLTRADLDRQIRIQQIVEKLGSGKIEVTDAQIADYMAQNKDMLPKTGTADEIKAMVKSQLESQAKNTNIQAWLENLKTTGTIIYR